MDNEIQRSKLSLPFSKSSIIFLGLAEPDRTQHGEDFAAQMIIQETIEHYMFQQTVNILFFRQVTRKKRGSTDLPWPQQQYQRISGACNGGHHFWFISSQSLFWVLQKWKRLLVIPGVSSCTRGGLNWVLGRASSQKRWSSIGMYCQWKHWRYLRDIWMWHSRTWFKDGTQQVRLMVGLHGLEGIFQPNSVILGQGVRITVSP